MTLSDRKTATDCHTLPQNCHTWTERGVTTAKKKLPRGIAEHRGKYRFRIVHKGESVSLGVYTTLTHAKGALAIARANIARGTFTTPRERKAAEGAAVEAAEREAARNRYTVDDLYRDFEEYEHSRGLTVSTIYSRESKYRVHARPVLGSMPVVDVTPQDHHGLVRQTARRQRGRS